MVTFTVNHYASQQVSAVPSEYLEPLNDEMGLDKTERRARAALPADPSEFVPRSSNPVSVRFNVFVVSSALLRRYWK